MLLMVMTRTATLMDDLLVAVGVPHQHAVEHNLVPGNHSGGRISVRIAVFPRSGSLCQGNECLEDWTIRTFRSLTSGQLGDLTLQYGSRKVLSLGMLMMNNML